MLARVTFPPYARLYSLDMCGINGFVGTADSPLGAMNGKTAHRGPDFAGVYGNGQVYLGHRLLAIREAAEGSRQPVQKIGSPWVFIFNGQIYNSKQIAKDFSLPYHDLDTTVIYTLIEKIGWNFIRHIQGMFAIALYNEKENELRLYRDQAGQKPLYYSLQNGNFAFSSEIKGLTAAGISLEACRDGLLIAGSLGYIPGRLTLYKDVYKLDAGEMLIFKDGAISERAYYTSDTSRFTARPKEVMGELVHEHLASKQKVALNLSGGMDSSVLLHEMKTAGHELITYTTAFEGAGEAFNDDAVIARRLAKDYGTKHTEIMITKDIYLKNFTESYGLIEEPNYNVSLPAYLEVAKREGSNGDGNRVILSGDGGDELFGGYPYYAKALGYDSLMKTTGPTLFSLGRWIRAGTYFDYGNPVDRWLSFKHFDFGAFPRDVGFVSAYLNDIAKTRAIPLQDPVRSQMLLDRAFWMPGENFIRSDKLYMSQSLEMRSPFAYEPLRAYFDARLKTDDYTAGGGNKRFLRALYDGVLPDYVTKRTAKTGWRSPVRPWYDERFKELFLSILRNTPRGGIVNWNMLKQEVEKKDSWPGKYFFLYLSLAILSKKHNVIL